MPVSHTNAKSAARSFLFCSRKGPKFFEPTSSSPSIRIVTSSGNEPVHRHPGAAGLDKRHQLALVVFRAARHDDLAAIGMGRDGRFERRPSPQIQRIDWLNIVVAIEQDMRPRSIIAVALGDDRGMPRRRANLGAEFQRRDIGGEMIGRRLAVSGKCRIGGDRFDTQQRKQPLQTVVEIGVDVVEDRLQLRCAGHLIFP